MQRAGRFGLLENRASLFLVTLPWPMFPLAPTRHSTMVIWYHILCSSSTLPSARLMRYVTMAMQATTPPPIALCLQPSLGHLGGSGHWPIPHFPASWWFSLPRGDPVFNTVGSPTAQPLAPLILSSSIPDIAKPPIQPLSLYPTHVRYCKHPRKSSSTPVIRFVLFKFFFLFPR